MKHKEETTASYALNQLALAKKCLQNVKDEEDRIDMLLEQKKTKLDSILESLEGSGFEPTLTEESYAKIMGSGLRTKNFSLAFVAAQIAYEQKPITLRGLMYQIVSAGFLPSTDQKHYNRVGRIMTTLREDGVVPFSWIVDNVRSTDKPSSWTCLEDFTDTVQKAYRKNFWAQLPQYVHIIVEKDAVAGTVAPITREYDVCLSPIRGYVSLSFANEIARTWNRIQKPIYCYYLGDFDASGFDLERDVKSKLDRYCTRSFEWVRLGVNKDDFAKYNLIPLKPKKTDTRYQQFVREHGSECAELDAIPANELRNRVEQAILAHIDMEQWERLQRVEELERESIKQIKFNTAG